MKALGERTGAAIVAVRHLNKSSGANPLYRGGSIGIIGAARCGLLLAQDPDDPTLRILATTKSNLGLPAPSLAFRLETVPALGAARVVWEGESTWSAASLLLDADDRAGGPSSLGAARQWLRETLADGPLPAKELEAEAREMGISLRTYRQARKLEGIVARKEHTLHGQWVVALPSPATPQPARRTEDDRAPGLP